MYYLLTFAYVYIRYSIICCHTFIFYNFIWDDQKFVARTMRVCDLYAETGSRYRSSCITLYLNFHFILSVKCEQFLITLTYRIAFTDDVSRKLYNIYVVVMLLFYYILLFVGKISSSGYIWRCDDVKRRVDWRWRVHVMIDCGLCGILCFITAAANLEFRIFVGSVVGDDAPRVKSIAGVRAALPSCSYVLIGKSTTALA